MPPAHHPIVFSTPMVEAIVAGKKSQTRRVVKPRSYIVEVEENIPYEMTEDDAQPIRCPYGEVGDILWVRETYQHQQDSGYIYKASKASREIKNPKWKPSIFMPKSACRIFLQVTNIRVEPLQDISEDDLKSEGIDYTIGYYPILLEAFEQLWAGINGQKSWDRNPYVWVIEFKVVNRPPHFV